MKINFLEETKDILRAHGKTAQDIVYVHDGTNYFSWVDFVVASAHVDYNNKDYCPTEINSQLTIRGRDWYLHRKSTLAHEFWEYCPTDFICDCDKVEPIPKLKIFQ